MFSSLKNLFGSSSKTKKPGHDKSDDEGGGFAAPVRKKLTAAEEAARDRIMERCNKLLNNMVDCKPADAERYRSMIRDILKSDKTVSMDFKTMCYDTSRERECNAHMREVDRLLHRAMELSALERLKERNQKVGEARKAFGKACGLGADDDFRQAFQNAVDNIMLSGGVQAQGPTRAKPKYDESLRTTKKAKE